MYLPPKRFFVFVFLFEKLPKRNEKKKKEIPKKISKFSFFCSSFLSNLEFFASSYNYRSIIIFTSTPDCTDEQLIIVRKIDSRWQVQKETFFCNVNFLRFKRMVIIKNFDSFLNLMFWHESRSLVKCAFFSNILKKAPS